MNYCCLIDCDNFFASCEKLFHPEYKNRPLVVVSGRNGIVIARSKEAKALGIPMAAASFEYKSLFIKEDVVVKNTNHTFYRDISRRVRETVETFSLPTFIYSVDEMFIQIPKAEFSEELIASIQKKIKQWTGIEVSIGVSTTKTLAKVATKLAKKTTSHRKALLDPEEITATLKTFPIEDIWGIGRRSHKKLKSYKVSTAFDLLHASDAFTKKLLGVYGRRIQSELKGVNAHPFVEEAKDKSLQITKTFHVDMVEAERIASTLASFITKGCEKLRAMKKEASTFTLFLESSRFKDNRNSLVKTFTLNEPSNYTPDFLHLKESFLEGFTSGNLIVKRAGIHFTDLTDESVSQQNLFCSKPKGSSKLMDTLDAINSKYGDKTLRFASVGKKLPSPLPKSPNYTTCWESLFEIDI